MLLAPAAGNAYSVRVDSDDFGVNYPLLPWDSPQVRDTQMSAISATGTDTVRAALSWRQLEPQAPSAGGHNYVWTASDQTVEELAAHGLRLLPAFLHTPVWAAPMSALTCEGQSASLATTKPVDYADAVAALTSRYGPGGTFWGEHPELPKLPITTWQIWNEPNLRTYWCPRPDPRAYAEVFARASAAIHAVDRRARVLTAGLVLVDRPGSYMSAGEFFAGMAAARPDIWSHADGIGFHVVPGGPLQSQFDDIARLRAHLTTADAPQGLPMFGTEVGWGLARFGLTEAQRAERYAYLTERLPSSNCNIGGMYAQAWTTSPPGGIVYDYDSGIADRTTGALFPSAVAFLDAIKVLSGKAKREAMHENLRHCAGMPKLDRDRDGRAEHRDYYPLDPGRWQGPPGWYTGVAVRAKRMQKLGDPIAVKVFCEENCRVKVSGRLALSGEKGKAAGKLRTARTKLKGGKWKALRLRPTAVAARQIKASDSSRGKAVIKARSVVQKEDFQDRARVRLR
jgi:hypothetical protein